MDLPMKLGVACSMVVEDEEVLLQVFSNGILYRRLEQVFPLGSRTDT